MDDSTIECEVEVGVSVITCEDGKDVVSCIEVICVVMGASEEDELGISGSSSKECTGRRNKEGEDETEPLLGRN